MSIPALLVFTVPGTRIVAMTHPCMEFIQKILPGGNWADTVLGWGNLNQDWYHVRADIDTNWEWCMPSEINEDDRNKLLDLLDDGSILMMVHYFERNGELTPHH